MSPTIILKSAIVIAPFTLLLGRAAQAFGLYMFMLVIPFLLIGVRRTNNILHFSRIGWALVGLYTVFPIFDALALIRGFEPTAEAWSGAHGWSFLLRSQYSSSVGIISLLIALTPYISRPMSPKIAGFKADEWVRLWMIGAVAANVVLLCVVIAQFGTGWNMSKAAAYRPDRLMASGFYRAAGACDHPIPFAGSILAQFGIYLHLATSKWAAPRWQKMACIWIAVASLICIVLSGSRFALIVVVFAMLLIVARLAKNTWQRLVAVSALGLCGAVVVKVTGMWERFAELSFGSLDGLLGGRSKLWQANWDLWQQSPTFGHGGAWLTNQIRKEWYEGLGMPEFNGSYNSHNLFLEILTSAGLVGLVMSLVMGYIFWRSWRRLYQTVHAPWARAVMLGLVLNFFHGLTQTAYFDSPVTMMLVYPFLLMFWADQLRESKNSYNDPVVKMRQ
jgi:O-antigen ligase